MSFFDIYFSLSVSLTVSLNVFYDAFLLWGLQKTFMGVHALGSQTLFYIPVRFLLFFTALSSRLLSASLSLSFFPLSLSSAASLEDIAAVGGCFRPPHYAQLTFTRGRHQLTHLQTKDGLLIHSFLHRKGKLSNPSLSFYPAFFCIHQQESVCQGLSFPRIITAAVL